MSKRHYHSKTSLKKRDRAALLESLQMPQNQSRDHLLGKEGFSKGSQVRGFWKGRDGRGTPLPFEAGDASASFQSGEGLSFYFVVQRPLSAQTQRL
jgi:hypothetical protein